MLHDRHSITNYWGAVRLALNAGYSVEEIGYNFPPTLYFNYLLKKYKLRTAPNNKKTNFHNLLKKKKVLLIDDNADKGWKAVLEKIFGENCVDSISFLMDVSQRNNKGNWELNDQFKIDDYDLLFLDLYIPEYQGKNPDIENGKLLLKLVKEKYPHVPVIVFTASNKAWTRDYVVNFGADGMYVKESPEYAGDLNYSKENFINFENTVKKTLEKYKVLRPYWEAIQIIINNTTFRSIPEKGNTKFKQRIEERLKMFYGLLKRGLEQTEFNEKQFYFSDYELAFMTLWSTLNEISEFSYVKTQPNVSIQDPVGNTITNHPGGQPITYINDHYKWDIIGQSDTYVDYSYSIRIDNIKGNPLISSSGRFYKLNYEQRSCFLFDNNQFQIVPSSKTKINYEKTLYLQIAYLIEKKDNLFKNKNKSIFQQTLVRLNEVRNQLFLTHGADISTGFYNQTEKEKRANRTITPNGDIKVLFELIYFLLTGNEIKININ